MTNISLYAIIYYENKGYSTKEDINMTVNKVTLHQMICKCNFMGVKAVFNFNNVAKVGVFFPAHVVKEATGGEDASCEDWVSKCIAVNMDTDMDISCESVGLFRAILDNLGVLNSDSARFDVACKRMVALIVMAWMGTKNPDYSSMYVTAGSDSIVETCKYCRYNDTVFTIEAPLKDTSVSSPLFYLTFAKEEDDGEKLSCYLNRLPEKIFKDKDNILRLVISTSNCVDTEVQLEAVGRRVPKEEAPILVKMV